MPGAPETDRSVTAEGLICRNLSDRGDDDVMDLPVHIRQSGAEILALLTGHHSVRHGHHEHLDVEDMTLVADSSHGVGYPRRLSGYLLELPCQGCGSLPSKVRARPSVSPLIEARRFFTPS